MKRTRVDVIRVRPSPLDRRRGRVTAGTLSISCALGRSGPTHRKREGDGATPIGRLRILAVLYRPDRTRRPQAGLTARPLRPDDGWCDDPGDRRYNRPVRFPHAARCERMWREDALYDVVVDLGHNRGPIRPGRGSAIFLHVAGPGFAPTEGCVAVERSAMARLLRRIGPGTRLVIG